MTKKAEEQEVLNRMACEHVPILKVRHSMLDHLKESGGQIRDPWCAKCDVEFPCDASRLLAHIKTLGRRCGSR